MLLDEIGDLDASSQVKLLRVIEDRTFRSVGADREVRVEARFVLATHKDLETLVEQGAFRRDLFERIRGFAITLPPLRERQEDLPMLAEHFLREFDAESGGRRSLPSTAVDPMPGRATSESCAASSARPPLSPTLRPARSTTG